MGMLGSIAGAAGGAMGSMGQAQSAAAQLPMQFAMQNPPDQIPTKAFQALPPDSMMPSNFYGIMEQPFDPNSPLNVGNLPTPGAGMSGGPLQGTMAGIAALGQRGMR